MVREKTKIITTKNGCIILFHIVFEIFDCINAVKYISTSNDNNCNNNYNFAKNKNMIIF
jgi:hypothetical protein